LEFVQDYGIAEHSHLMMRVESITRNGDEFVVTSTDLITGRKHVTRSDFICVTSGILSHDQYSLQERGVHIGKDFTGEVVHAAKLDGVECPLGSMDLKEKKVVILGSGSFAAEAFEAAERQGCSDITVIGRPRYRLVLPFSRQYTVSAIANAPFLPWSWRMKIALSYIKRNFYKPCNLMHWAPQGKPSEMDFSGQCNDAYFRLSYEGKLKCVVDDLVSLSSNQAHLKSGVNLPCDVLVVASGLKYNMQPSFLSKLGLDYSQLHNFAFLGKNPRIGCAADFLFAYVPFGPMKQLDMFFHSVECCKSGLEGAMSAALEPTPLPNHGEGFLSGGRMAGSYTFFEYSHWWSFQSKALEVRVDSMLRTLDVGKSLSQKISMRLGFLSENIAEWFRCVKRSFQEIHRFKIYGQKEKTEGKSTDGTKQGVHVTC
jgi:hypothetical protein